jgi:hypothetical protein
MKKANAESRHEENIMRLITATLTLALLAGIAFAQDSKRVILSPKSTINTSSIAEGFAKYCPNILVTEDAAKADYVLEAAETKTFSDGDSHEHWHFTLLGKDGDVIFTTHPKFSLHGLGHHFQDTCDFINGKKKKK